MITKIIRHVLSPTVIRKIKVAFSRWFGGNTVKGQSGNTLILNDAILKRCNIRFHGKNSTVQIGGGNTLCNCGLEIFGNNDMICIGNNNSFVDSTFWLEDRGSKIIIGDNNRMCGKVHMGIVEGTILTIGNNCLFSSDIYITTTDSHSIIDIESGKRINPSKDVTINDHVWIGHRATIGKGVSIASDVIVGGSSYVTKSITESGVAVAGVPAKIVRKGINWDINRI